MCFHLIVYKAFKNAIISSYKNQIVDMLFESINKFLYKLIETSLKVLKALLNFLVIPSFSARIHSLKTNDLTFLMFTFNIETSAGFAAFFYWCPLQRVFLKIIVPVAKMVYNELRYDVCL